MTTFKVIDTTTGREVSAEKIEKIAKEWGLMEMDIDQFFIGEDGSLILVDDCGKSAYCNKEEMGLMPVFESRYPDLEYFESIFLSNIYKHYPEAFKDGFWQPKVELVGMFPQTWPNTAGGFSEPGMMSGQAFTTELTTVMRIYAYNSKESYYGVFFGKEPAYIVDKANNTFLEDLKNQNLKSRYEARKFY